jgi:hypothetical protein
MVPGFENPLEGHPWLIKRLDFKHFMVPGFENPLEGHLLLTKRLDFINIFMVPGFENPLEGHLVLTKRLDFELLTGFEVDILARDRGNPHRGKQGNSLLLIYFKLFEHNVNTCILSFVKKITRKQCFEF